MFRLNSNLEGTLAREETGGKVFFVNKSLRNLRIVLSIPRRRRRTFVFFSLLLHRGEGGRKMDVGQEGGREGARGHK